MRDEIERNAKIQSFIDEVANLHRRAHRRARRALKLGLPAHSPTHAGNQQEVPSGDAAQTDAHPQAELHEQVEKNARVQALVDQLADLHRQANRKARRTLRHSAHLRAQHQAALAAGDAPFYRRWLLRLRRPVVWLPASWPGKRLWRWLRRNRHVLRQAGLAALFFLAMGVLPFAAALLTNSSGRIEAGIACARQHVLVEAADGRPLGVLRRKLPETCPDSAAAMRAHRVDEEALRNPEGSWEARALSVLEGDFLSTSPWVVAGVDIRGPLRAVSNLGNIGGSNPLISSVELLIGQPRGWLRHPMKLYNYAATMIYTTTHLRDDRARLRFVLEHSVCMTSTGRSGAGLDIAGSECPRLLFGKRFGKLSPAEACIWAASLRYPLLGRRSRARHWEIQRKILNRIKGRARGKCLRRLFRKGWISRQELALEQQRIGRWAARLHLHTIGGRQIFSMLPYSRLHPGMSRLLLDEAKALNMALRDRVRTTLLIRPQQRLLNHISRYGAIGPDMQAVLAVYEVDAAGRALLRLAYATNHAALRNDGRQPQGSLNKPWIALRAHQAGLTVLCNRKYGKLVNAGGDRGQAVCTGRAMVPIGMALARSMNLPFIWAVQKLGTRKLAEYFASLGYMVTRPVSPPGMALGYEVTISPHLLVRNWARLDARTRGLAVSERLAEPAVFVRGQEDAAFAGRALSPLRAARALLASPWNGTLRRLKRALVQAGCAPGIGKTGTVETTRSNEARAKIIIATFTCRGRHYLAYARAETERPGLPLSEDGRAWPFRMIALAAGFLNAN